MIQVDVCILRVTQVQRVLSIRDIQVWVGAASGLFGVRKFEQCSSHPAVQGVGKRNTRPEAFFFFFLPYIPLFSFLRSSFFIPHPEAALGCAPSGLSSLSRTRW